MKAILFWALALFTIALHAEAAPTPLKLTHLRGHIYVVEDEYPLSDENSVVYVGDQFVTVVGATWTPETARRLADMIARITAKPIREVIDTNYNLDRAGGNAYFRSIGARIVSTRLTRDLLQRDWAKMVDKARTSYPGYPDNPLALPDNTYPGNFELQGGRVRGLYLGPSHAPDDIFVYFPQEQVLFGGCILKEQLGNMAFADVAEYPKTLRKLQRLNLGYTTVIAGHWSPIHGPELVDQYLRLLDEYSRSRPTGF